MHIGVTIPLFKQAQFLIECVTSVLSQTLMPTGIVIVNDGCPNPSSDTLPRAIAAAWPDLVLYLHQENRGLSGARNTGIRALLNRWPEIEAILPLDADDWLEEYSLETMAARLASEDHSDWVYPDLQSFGSEFQNWRPCPRLNQFRLFFENQCAAPSLIRRRLFDTGIFYDETMREGYEDWEFFLRALSRGSWGISGGSVGVNYRVRTNSMIVETRKKHKPILKSIHGRLFVKPWTLTACEHKHMPRFRFIGEHGHSCDFSDPMLAPAWDRNIDQGYVPPVTILGSRTAFELLKRSGILRGILFFVQHQVRTHALKIVLKHREIGLAFEREQDVNGMPALLAVQSAWLAEGSVSADNIPSVVASANGLIISSRDHKELALNSESLDFELLLRHASVLASDEVETAPLPLESRQPSHSSFAREHHLISGETTYPLTRNGKIDICFVIPWIRFGDLDRCVLKLAEAVKRSTIGVRLHLLLTNVNVVDLQREQVTVFDEIVSVAYCEEGERLQMLSCVLSSMDVVINAHSLLGYQALRLLPKRSAANHRPVSISYLHEIDVAADERHIGYRYLAREYENESDCFLVVSEQLRDFLINSGVNEERIRIGRDAPVIRPPTREQGLLMADQKAARQACAGYQFEFLFAGQLDVRTSVRLAALIRLADREGVNFRVAILGSTTLDGEQLDFPAKYVRLLEATSDPTTLSRYYEDVDGVILLSPGGGVPLVLHDAMAHGCVVFAIEMGVVNELVVDGVNGFLCPSSGSDDMMARATLDRVKVVLADASGCRDVRRRATEAAMDLTWDQVAMSLDELLVQARQARAYA